MLKPRRAAWLLAFAVTAASLVNSSPVLLPRKHFRTQLAERQLRQSGTHLIPPREEANKAKPEAKAANGSSLVPPGPRMSFADYAQEETSISVCKYELVIARLDEDIQWLSKIPAFWKITIYNKGGYGSPVPEVSGRSLSVVELPNHGREGETYMHHIVLRWDTLAEYTVFSQAQPFIHSPHFTDLLSNPHLLGPVQCMSLVYVSEGHPHNITPKEVVEAYRKHPWFRAERLSLRTLDSLYFTDVGATNIARSYLAMHSLPPGTNIIAHHFDIIGLKGWVPHEQEVGSFAYGGQFGVHRDKIRQHSRSVYESMMASLIASDWHAWIAERMYLMLFGGRHFTDV